ncbi:hypothetical protein FRAHR75_530024 [Frankia sp. Hr75.2]|nr:hypothetical protein FRAHR75_530024 [Frankia sp. Hr75.2]
MRTPTITFARLKGSVAPLRLRTRKEASSMVVNRRPQAGHDRRRRIAAPSSASLLSTTRLSGCRQKGHRMVRSPPPRAG